MNEPAETRESLLIRLRDPNCDRAWQEFSAIYRPMVYRLARQCGLQDCDAEDVTQRVLVSISRTIGSWQKDAAKGRFRGWLTTVTKNAVRNAFSRAPRDQPAENCELSKLVDGSYGDVPELDQRIETEFMRSVFREAARRVKAEFADSTWKAFWLTSVEGVSVSDASQQLSMTSGAIYAARSRIMRRLQCVASEMTEED